MKYIFTLLIFYIMTGDLCSQVNLTNGLIAYYPFNGNTMDESGNGNHGANTGASLTTDRFGLNNSAYFFENNSLIECGSGASINNISGNLSISAWINFTSANLGGLNSIVTKWAGSAADDHFGLWITNASKILVGTGHPSYVTGGITFDEVIPENVWSLITFVWEVGGTFKLYVNGQFKQEVTAANNGVISASTAAVLRIGNDNGSRAFDGKIDDARIYSRCLNDAEILALYTQTVLPVLLKSFEIEPKSHSVKLNWTTAQERNNEGFIVQKSIDGRHWDELIFIAGQGNTDQEQNYQTVDTQPVAGTNYYRLKQIDFDGTFAYSQILTVSIESEVLNECQVYPNPFRNDLNFKNFFVGIEIYSLDGQIQFSKSDLLENSAINLSFLNPGIYYLKTFRESGPPRIQQIVKE